MEKYKLEKDIHTCCRAVEVFPQGIPQAFDELSKKLPLGGEKTFYGISYESKAGDIVYKVAVSVSFPWDGEKYGYESYTIAKGDYITETILDWRQNISAIGPAFMALCKHPGIKPNAVCVEWYKTNTELICMVKI